jgi:hypothetical protein
MRTRILRFPQSPEISVIWHQLTGEFRRIWSDQPLNTFSEALEAFRTAITYRFLKWVQKKIGTYLPLIKGVLATFSLNFFKSRFSLTE